MVHFIALRGTVSAAENFFAESSVILLTQRGVRETWRCQGTMRKGGGLR